MMLKNVLYDVHYKLSSSYSHNTFHSSIFQLFLNSVYTLVQLTLQVLCVFKIYL